MTKTSSWDPCLFSSYPHIPQTPLLQDASSEFHCSALLIPCPCVCLRLWNQAASWPSQFLTQPHVISVTNDTFWYLFFSGTHRLTQAACFLIFFFFLIIYGLCILCSHWLSLKAALTFPVAGDCSAQQLVIWSVWLTSSSLTFNKLQWFHI